MYATSPDDIWLVRHYPFILKTLGYIIVDMPRRKHYRKQKIKFKLKKGTVYSIFAFGFIVLGIILLLSFSRNGSSFILINDLLNKYFGGTAFLFPFVLIFFGFLFFKLKMFLSGVNVSLGYLLFFLSLSAFTRGGVIGDGLFGTISSILNDIIAKLIYFAGILIGLIVFFNTSVDQVIAFLHRIFRNLHRLFPSSFLGFFKNKSKSEFKDTPMRIKGGQKIIPNMSTGASVASSQMIIKEPPLLSDQLVSNPLAKAGMW